MNARQAKSKTSDPVLRMNPAGNSEAAADAKNGRRFDSGAALALAILVGVFLLLAAFMPMRTAIRIGADEGFELAKATLSLRGFKSYTDMWNDQPLLHTLIITEVLKHVSTSVLGPRLVTSAFVLVLLTAVFFVGLRMGGLLVATLSVALLIPSPGFLELGSSCMVEIPALAPAVFGLGILLFGRRTKRHFAEIITGILFGASLQIKFIGAIYLPLAGLIIWLRHRQEPLPATAVARAFLILGTGLALSFVFFSLLSGEGAFFLQLQQSWAAHFATGVSIEYGSPADHPFDWNLLVKNWDLTVPAIVGVVVLVRHLRQTLVSSVPLAWLALTFLVFGIHTPWWSDHYVHNAVPLCLCAAIGIGFLFKRVSAGRSKVLAALLGAYVLCAGPWLGARIYLEVTSARNSPQIFSSLVLGQMETFKPFTRFMYTEEPVYSFHSGIPMPPKLAIVSLKRLWSGDLTNARINAELESIKPELMLLANDSRELPFNDLLTREYRLMYVDTDHRLFALKTMIVEANRRKAR